MKKLDKLQNHSTHTPNISENINHIRQLIQQARNAASKVDPPHTLQHNRIASQRLTHLLTPPPGVAPPPQVSVPVKFNGVSGIQVRTPPNLADLASYTSLKLYITLPEAARARRQDDGSKQFVFYLGNKDVSVTIATKTFFFKFLCWWFDVLVYNNNSHHYYSSPVKSFWE